MLLLFKVDWNCCVGLALIIWLMLCVWFGLFIYLGGWFVFVCFMMLLVGFDFFWGCGNSVVGFYSFLLLSLLFTLLFGLERVLSGIWFDLDVCFVRFEFLDLGVFICLFGNFVELRGLCCYVFIWLFDYCLELSFLGGTFCFFDCCISGLVAVIVRGGCYCF